MTRKRHREPGTTPHKVPTGEAADFDDWFANAPVQHLGHEPVFREGSVEEDNLTEDESESRCPSCGGEQLIASPHPSEPYGIVNCPLCGWSGPLGDTAC